MSKYTTEVRFICEQKSGLSESSGFSDIDKVINESWDKIFTTKVAFFDEDYRSVLCSKILKHFYLREIGTEVVGVWLLWLNTRLEEVMPYYNQLYNSAKINFNPLHDVDITRIQKKNVNGSTQEDGTRSEKSEKSRDTNGNSDSNATGTGTRETSENEEDISRDLYSDTPQGALTGVENETYLTNARKVSKNNSNSVNENTSTSEKSGTDYEENVSENGSVSGSTSTRGVSNSTEDYIETLVGKQGGGDYSSMLMKFRETFLNIDLQVIHEFDDLFMGLW